MHFSRAALGAVLLVPGIATAQIDFGAATTYPLVGLRPDGVATGDFDGANGVDFALTSGTPQGGFGPEYVEVFLNQGGGTFVHGQTILLGNNVGAAEVVAGDFDLDGDIDLAVAQHNTSSVRILLNQAGTFVLGGTTPSGGNDTRAIAAGDIDGDGDIDLAASNRGSNNVSLFTNNGLGTFALAGLVPTGLEPFDLALADLNGDCRTDIAVAAHDGRAVNVIFNQGAGTFGAFVSIPVPGNNKPSGMFAADLDGDGDIDLATTTDNNNVGLVVVLRNLGAGTFTSQTFLTNSLNPGAIVAADFDGDGLKDVATVDEDGSSVSVLPNLGNATFGAARTQAVGTHPGNIAGADFDGNGSIEIVVTNRDSNTASVLPNATTGGTSMYCATSPNSGGFATRIDSTGSVSIAANSFTLLARCAPSGSTGVFYFGTASQFAAFGNGHRCVGGTLVRLGPPMTADATGHASRVLDFTSTAGSSIGASSTRYFQYWHRDAAAGGSQFNLSDALSATFRP